VNDCPFCKIVVGELPAAIVWRSPDAIAFRDIHPQAPTHILIVPTKHLISVNDLQAEDFELMGRLIATAKDIAHDLGLRGYRLVINTGREAGQSVFHLHVHLLAGRSLHWPPG
jgi:histidine triad (HIT) family protein